MLPASIRAVCAAVAVASFLGGIGGLTITGNGWFLAALGVAAVLVMPAMFGGPMPTSGDLPRIEAELLRYGWATMLSFTAAAVSCIVTIAWRNRQTGALSIACWLVAFVLMFFFAYYRAQRRLALGEDARV